VVRVEAKAIRVTSRLRASSEEVRALEEQLRMGGGADRIARQHKQGKLTARERIAALCDTGERFLEIGLLVAHDKYEGQAPGVGVVTGIGIVSGRHVVVVANDATVKAGSWWPETITKMLRAQEIAMRSRVPIIYLVDSAGVILPYQGGVFPGQYGAHGCSYNSIIGVSASTADRGGDGPHRRWRVSPGAVGRDPDGEGDVLHGAGRPEPGQGRDGPGDRQ
jgi:acetyl-CoA carboxylase carboxyltransferase component